MAVRSGHRDQEPQPVLAADGVEAGPGVMQDVVQQRAREAVLLDAAGGALEADPGRVLGPVEQIGHRQPGRARDIAGQGELCHRIGGRKGLTHGLPPPE